MIPVHTFVERWTEFESHGVLISVMGAGGSGKTTFGRKLAHDLDCDFISLDDLRACLSPWGESWDPSTTDSARIRMHQAIKTRLMKNQTVVVDAAVVSRLDRDRIVQLSRKHYASALAVVVVPPLKEVLRRNNKRAAEPGRCGISERSPSKQIRHQYDAIVNAVPDLTMQGWTAIALVN
jgi:predicted kinase